MTCSRGVGSADCETEAYLPHSCQHTELRTGVVWAPRWTQVDQGGPGWTQVDPDTQLGLPVTLCWNPFPVWADIEVWTKKVVGCCGSALQMKDIRNLKLKVSSLMLVLLLQG